MKTPLRLPLQIILLLFVATALTSVGGFAIYASPLLLALLWFASRRAPVPVRVIGIVLAGFVVAETAWGATYILAGGPVQPLIWIVPLIAVAVALPLFGHATSPERHRPEGGT